MKPKYRKGVFLSIFLLIIFSAALYLYVSNEINTDHINHALISAVKGGNAILVRAALSQGADPNSRDRGGITVATLISERFARLLGKRFHAAEKAPTALFLAINTDIKNQSIINDLLKHGADPNARGDYYRRKNHVSTLILYSAMDGDQETIQALAKAGADVNVTDEYGNTTLNMICFYANPKTVQLLLNQGANPNIKGSGGESCLLAAVNGENAEVVRLLIEHGARRDIATSWSASNSVLQKCIYNLLRESQSN